MASAEPSAAPAGCRVDLSGQVALVTGASRGIGRAIAQRLAACGATVAGVARTLEGLEGTLGAIREAGGTAEAFAANVADSADVKRVVDEVEAKFQKIHVLVNNAGITRDGLLLRMEDDAWQEVIDTNLKGTFLFCRAVGRLYDASAVRADHQHQQRLGADGQPGPGELLGQQGGRDRLLQDDRPRAGLARDHGQRRGPRVHHHRHDRRAPREGQGRGQGARSPSAGWGRPRTSPTWSATWPAPAPAT